MTRYTAKFVTLQNGIILSTRDGFAPNFTVKTAAFDSIVVANFVLEVRNW